MTGLPAEIKQIATTVAVPYHEPPAVVIRRRIVVAVVLVIGAAVLGFTLTRRPGDPSFIWLTLLLAAVWTVGAFASGPLHLGSIRWRGRNQRPVITPTVIGLLLAAAFVVGGFLAREIGPVRELITGVLEYSRYGSLWLLIVITVVNGVAEELFFRGALYTALGRILSGGGLDGALCRSDTGERQPDARSRCDHPRHGLRPGAASHRRRAGSCAHPLRLGIGRAAGSARGFRPLTRRDMKDCECSLSMLGSPS